MVDPNNLENQVQLLMAQVAALQAQPQVQAPNPDGPFALTPAQATQDVIDVTQLTGIKLYKAITMPLDTKFDGSSSKLLAFFLDNIEQKALRYGWTDHLLSISSQDPINPQNRNLVQQHRMLTIENMQNHAVTYIGTQTRLAQDASMMYKFLRDSLTEGARARLATESAKYTINGIRDGPSYLKTLLTKFYVETKATNFHIHQKLQRLRTKIVELKYDVVTFNNHVMELVQDLAGGGKTSDDLIVYLFKAYLKVKDESFKRYIEGKKEVYDKGTNKDVTVGILMDLALVKYNQLSQANKLKHGEKSDTSNQKQLFALVAQLKEAMSSKGSKPTKDKGEERKTNKFKVSHSAPSKGKDGSNNKPKAKPAWCYQWKGNTTTVI